MHKLRSFARTVGHSISENQRNLLEANSRLDISDFLSKSFSEFVLEIGFGSGENLLNLALNTPSAGFIGVEPFINGVVKVLCKIQKDSIKNIFVYSGDIYDILDKFPDNLFEKIFILFPDPWPKKKQQKRRLVDKNFLLKILQKTKREILFATDDENYFSSVNSICQNFNIQSKELNDRPEFLLQSKYEKKALENNRKPEFLKIYK